MPLGESVTRALRRVAADEHIPASAVNRLELLASALADAEFEATSASEMDRRIELVLNGFDFDDRGRQLD